MFVLDFFFPSVIHSALINWFKLFLISAMKNKVAFSEKDAHTHHKRAQEEIKWRTLLV